MSQRSKKHKWNVNEKQEISLEVEQNVAKNYGLTFNNSLFDKELAK